MTVSPKISVVIPTFNASPFIRDTLASVFAQTRLPDEVIVVDDCSTDDTIEVIEGIAQTAPLPVRVIRLAANSGSPAKPLTVGFDEARSDLIAALDQDDIFLPGKLMRQAALLDKNPEICCAFGACAKMNTPDLICHQSVFDMLADVGTTGVLTGQRMLSFLLTYGQFLIGFPGFTFRRSAWEATRPLDLGLRIAADYDFLCRLTRHGKFGMIHEAQYLWRSHDRNLTKQGLQTILETALILRRELKLLSQQSNHSFDEIADRKQLIRKVRQNLKRELLDASYFYRKNYRFRQATTTCTLAVWYGAIGSGLVEALKIVAETIRAGFGSRKTRGQPPRPVQ